MNQYYRTIAETNFGDEPDIKVREELAEQFLVRQYLGEKGGFFVEVGANNPFDLSQTWHLAQLGWKGILIEPIPSLCSALREKRPESTVIEAACSSPSAPTSATFTVAQDSGKSTLADEFLDKRSDVLSQITVKLSTLDSMLQDNAVSEVDFVSIDVEGTQFDVLLGFDLQKWKPRLVLVEDHLLDKNTHKLLVGQGYQLVKRTLFNNWYIPDNAEPPKTGKEEDRILRGKFRRILVRNLRFKIRRLFGRGL
ncbi:MAG: FkbM family methyltransferase [Phycisphaerae bacterium]|jgi:FkbM family methyltransferase|nr:FkbM family methyltransferase [Phycisphaerae bacterium]